ncbi:cysteine protease, putative [Entamoeba invadens IP1]|uniref:cysteine protease, putative n=1 Tax=Entamoeba invadens IP1 TaxID=370355 RepID=UPI0002C3E148|nr:cysteine protease, putative [Entamoeba invadens IP1]ELP85014.1 cysteine protease, putative [Entamoeba invadens IP1]|eukprot:XP_004184360.1 cysteine protease, putative [Entamoeba invadens IP1]
MIILLLLLLTFCTANLDDFNAPDLVLFSEFETKFNRRYLTPANRLARLAIFRSSLKKIRERSISNNLQKYQINQFTDMYPSEISMGFTAPKEFDHIKSGDYPPADTPVDYYNVNEVDLPTGDRLPMNLSYCGDYVNYNTERVKVDLCGDGIDQGQCGSCYASAMANYIQIRYANISYYSNNRAASQMQKPVMSVQKLLDLTVKANVWENMLYSYRCCGGNPMNCAEAAPIVVSGVDYPYTDYETKSENYNATNNPPECVASGVNAHPNAKKYIKVKKYRAFNFKETGEKKVKLLKKVLHHYGAFFVGINAMSFDFYQYGGGVYTMAEDGYCTNGYTNHLIIIVGYGKDTNGNEYFIGRNTWGASWGEKGYVRISTKVLCAFGYYTTSFGSTGLMYGSSCDLDKGCASCDSNFDCTGCKAGYTMDELSKTCMKLFNEADFTPYKDCMSDGATGSCTDDQPSTSEHSETNSNSTSTTNSSLGMSIVALLLLFLIIN